MIKYTNKLLLILSISFLFHTAQYAQQSKSAVATVENHLVGELDYSFEALDLVQRKADGTEISLGQIKNDGSIHFSLPKYDIRALFDSINLQHYKLQNLLEMYSCKGKATFAETPFDDVYAKKYHPIYVKKYGMNIAALYPVSNEEIVSRNQNNRAIYPGDAKYFWLYIDRDIAYTDECIKTSSWGTDKFEVDHSANIQFKKGWNFIEENLVEVYDVGEGDARTTTPKTIRFSVISPESKKVKWVLKQIKEDEKIETAKRLYNFTPITKEKFEKWVPNKIGDLSLTTQEHGTLPRGQKNKNNIHVIFTNASQEKEIDLYVVDCAKSPNDMEMIYLAYAMDNKGIDDKDIKPYITQYNDETKATQLFYKVDDRLIVSASGVNINAEELWGYVKKLNVEKLIKR